VSQYLHQFDLAAAAVTEAQLRGAYEMGIAHGRSGQRIGDPRQGDITHWSGCDSIHPECRNEHESIRHDLTSILTDLIAELREHAEYHEQHHAEAADDFAAAADRAEARLEEVQGE